MGHSYTGRAHASTLNSLWAAPTVSTPQGQSCQWAWTGLNPAYWLVAVSATAGGLALTANLTPGGVRNSGQVANVGQWLQVTGLDASLVAITNTSLAIQATQWTAPTVSSPTTNTIVSEHQCGQPRHRSNHLRRHAGRSDAAPAVGAGGERELHAARQRRTLRRSPAIRRQLQHYFTPFRVGADSRVSN